MTTKVNMNGQARKSLSEQIDRLDCVLDGLADGINDTVVAAVKEAVGAAVQAVLREVLSSPELLARLAVAVPNATWPPVKPNAGWKQRWLDVSKALTARLNPARQWCVRRLAAVGRWTVGVSRQLRLLACYRNQLLAAVGVGMTVAAAALIAGPWLSAAFSGVCGFVATAAVQAGMVFRRLLTATSLPGYDLDRNVRTM